MRCENVIVKEKNQQTDPRNDISRQNGKHATDVLVLKNLGTPRTQQQPYQTLPIYIPIVESQSVEIIIQIESHQRDLISHFHSFRRHNSSMTQRDGFPVVVGRNEISICECLCGWKMGNVGKILVSEECLFSVLYNTQRNVCPVIF